MTIFLDMLEERTRHTFDDVKMALVRQKRNQILGITPRTGGEPAAAYTAANSNDTQPDLKQSA